MMIVRAIQGNLELELINPSTTPLKEITKDASFIAMTPMQASSCLKKCPNKYRHLDKVLLGGAPIDSKLEKDLLNLKPRGFYHSYGMTETASHVAIRELSKENEKKKGEKERKKERKQGNKETKKEGKENERKKERGNKLEK